MMSKIWRLSPRIWHVPVTWIQPKERTLQGSLSKKLTLAVVVAVSRWSSGDESKDAGWGPWNGVCTVTCGGGRMLKVRKCQSPGPNKCKGRSQMFVSCNTHPCPVVPKPLSNKGWTPWMPWECPVTCGGGKGTRSRICEDPDVCEGPEEETGRCAEEPCPVDPDKLDESFRKQIEQQLKTSRHSFVVQVGETVNIPCKNRMASSVDREFPGAKVTWITNGELTQVDGKRVQMEEGGDLKVKTTVEDSGLWWCSVELTKKESVTLSFASIAVQNESPDLVVDAGQPIVLQCKARTLGRLVGAKSRLDQKWVHNSSTFRELKGVDPEDEDTLDIPVSNASLAGIWNCRYSEQQGGGGREWTTSVYRVAVNPARTAVQVLALLVAVAVLSVAVVTAVGCLYWKRVKKRRLAEWEDEDEEYDEEDDEEQEPLFADRLRNYRSRRDS